MYKLTIEEIIGEVRKVTTLETEDVELVKLLLLKEERIQVDSDVPNRNINKEWQELMDWYKKELNKRSPVVQPYQNPGSPWQTPFDPNNPFTVTC